ncbi:MAG: diguanylate cyclase [Ramlibacter sp.]|nr:diguanylate cyclase [Ramlibacter sp.]MDB5911500.1 diguanylate cyclase [Ramlibacter sp.]
MRRSTISALGAFLLWCAVLAGSAWAQPVALESTPAALPPAVEVGGGWPVSLYDRSVYWGDDHAELTIDQVEAQAARLPWRVRHRDRQDRSSAPAQWISFEAAVPVGEHWYLEVAAAIYDNVQMYYRDGKGAWVLQEAGTTVPVAQWSTPGRVPTFSLAHGDSRPVRYWLRVQDARADFASALTLYRDDTLQAKREKEQFLFGAYFGLAALIVLASLAHGLIYADRPFLVFAVYAACLVTGQLGRAGIGAQYVWNEWEIWNGAALALWPGIGTATALWFAKVVTEPARLSRALDLGVWAMIAATLGAVALDVVIGTRASMTLVLASTFVSLLAIMGTVLWGWLDDHDPNLRLIALGFAPVLVMALFPLARGFGLLPSNVLTRLGLFFGSALQLPILYYALHVRLMARREGVLRTVALSRSDALTGLPDRQALIDRLESSLAHARGQKQNCALLGIRISNLDAIVEEFGQVAAEKAMVVAASHLRRTAVDFDMAARVGEREFAVLLEAPVTAESTTSRAQQVVASGLRQVEALPAALTLKFHVVSALLPQPQLDGAGTLQWVLDSLDQIEPEARKLIRPLNFEFAGSKR